jgi:hypothetical protein
VPLERAGFPQAAEQWKGHRNERELPHLDAEIEAEQGRNEALAESVRSCSAPANPNP